MYFANDAWLCDGFNLIGLLLLKAYFHLIKKEIHYFVAFSPLVIVPDVSQQNNSLVEISNEDTEAKDSKKHKKTLILLAENRRLSA